VNSIDTSVGTLTSRRQVSVDDERASDYDNDDYGPQ